MEFDHSYLIKKILNKLQTSQIDKEYFLYKHGENCYNVFHYAAFRISIKVLEYLYGFEPKIAKELLFKKNDNNEVLYEIAQEYLHNDFCSEINMLGKQQEIKCIELD